MLKHQREDERTFRRLFKLNETQPTLCVKRVSIEQVSNSIRRRIKLFRGIPEGSVLDASDGKFQTQFGPIKPFKQQFSLKAGVVGGGYVCVKVAASSSSSDG